MESALRFPSLKHGHLVWFFPGLGNLCVYHSATASVRKKRGAFAMVLRWCTGFLLGNLFFSVCLIAGWSYPPPPSPSCLCVAPRLLGLILFLSSVHFVFLLHILFLFMCGGGSLGHILFYVLAGVESDELALVSATTRMLRHPLQGRQRPPHIFSLECFGLCALVKWSGVCVGGGCFAAMLLSMFCE